MTRGPARVMVALAALGVAAPTQGQPVPEVADGPATETTDEEVEAPFLWRYRTPDGREAFTGDLARVPAQARDVAPVDVSHVSLNQELGNDLRDQIAAQLSREGIRVATPATGGPLPEGDRRLDEDGVAEAVSLERDRAAMVRSAACEAVREGEDQPGLVERLFTDHLHLPVLALLALVLVSLGPTMARRLSAPQWIRFVTFVLPLLGFLGFTTSTVVEAARMQRRMKEAVRVCDPGLMLGPLDSAAALAERLEVVDALRAVTTERGLIGRE